MKKKMACWIGVWTIFSSAVSAESLFFRLEGAAQPLCLTVSSLSHEDNPMLMLSACHAENNQAFYFLDGYLFSNARAHDIVTYYRVGRYDVALLSSFHGLARDNKPYFMYHNGYLMDVQHVDFCLFPQVEQDRSMIVYGRCRDQKRRWEMMKPDFTDELLRSPEGLCATFEKNNEVHLEKCAGTSRQRWHYDYITGQVSSFHMVHQHPYCWAASEGEEGALLVMKSCRLVPDERFNFITGQSIFYRRLKGYYVAPRSESLGAVLYLHKGFLLYPFTHRTNTEHEIRFLQEE